MKICFVLVLTDRAIALGQDLSKIPFKDRSWLGYKTRSSKSLVHEYSSGQLCWKHNDGAVEMLSFRTAHLI